MSIFFVLCNIIIISSLFFHYYFCYSLRPWDPMNDLIQFEKDYIIQTKTRHRTPIVRTMSITNVDEHSAGSQRHHTSIERVRALRIKRASIKRLRALERNESGSSTPDVELIQGDSESSDSGGECISL